MAEVKNIRFSCFLKYLLLFLIIPGVPLLVSAQDEEPQRQQKKKIEILHVDVWQVDETVDKDLQQLLGNVSMKHKDVYMYCDSAYYYQDKNQVQAYSRIHIQQGDTLHLYGNYLFYDGETEFAYIENNVELIDKETHLFTTAVTYDFVTDIAHYNNHGRIINGDNTLTSRIGIYYATKSLYHFKDSVKIVNPDYIMTADTMDYNTETETALFTGPSELVGDSLYLYCERGWYDTKNDKTSIWENALIDNKQQIIKGDSLYYDDISGFGESFGNISIIDTTDNMIVRGHYAWYYKVPEKFMVTDSALFIQISGSDSLFLHADTLRSVSFVADTAGSQHRTLKAYYKCRVFSNDIQAKCDSLSYSFRDSVIRLYHEPILWSEENQLTADSMAVFTKNQNADRLELYNLAFITSKVDSMRFNQIKGRSLTGYFKENELYRIVITGNGESIYYLLDNDELSGVNRAKCSNIEIFIDDGKITEIYEYQEPEGVIDPPSDLPEDNPRLEGFSWYETIRPRKIEDIFK